MMDYERLYNENSAIREYFEMNKNFGCGEWGTRPEYDIVDPRSGETIHGAMHGNDISFGFNGTYCQDLITDEGRVLCCAYDAMDKNGKPLEKPSDIDLTRPMGIYDKTLAYGLKYYTDVASETLRRKFGFANYKAKELLRILGNYGLKVAVDTGLDGSENLVVLHNKDFEKKWENLPSDTWFPNIKAHPCLEDTGFLKLRPDSQWFFEEARRWVEKDEEEFGANENTKEQLELIDDLEASLKWYAVIIPGESNFDLEDGSLDYDEALKMAKRVGATKICVVLCASGTVLGEFKVDYEDNRTIQNVNQSPKNVSISFEEAYDNLKHAAASIPPGKEERVQAALDNLKASLAENDPNGLLSIIDKGENPITAAQEVISAHAAAQERAYEPKPMEQERGMGKDDVERASEKKKEMDR